MIINSFGYILSGFCTFSYFWWKMTIVVVQAKSTQNSYFLVSKPILKKFPRLFLAPNPSYAKNRAKRASEWVFYRGPPFSMSIPEAPSYRVKILFYNPWLKFLIPNALILQIVDILGSGSERRWLRSPGRGKKVSL